MVNESRKRVEKVIIAGYLLYTVISWVAFAWRNPTANEMAFFRDHGAVIMWEKLDRYQGTSEVNDDG